MAGKDFINRGIILESAVPTDSCKVNDIPVRRTTASSYIGGFAN